MGQGRYLKPGLYVTATPIGNLGDISDRARSVLESADLIACEDTRVTGRLMSAMGLKGSMMAYHEHNGDAQRPKILARIAAGERVVLVSDAGTPLISDPGYKLVEEAHEAGLLVVAIPGASALTAAISIAGLPSDRFLFMGFSPHKSKARQTWFADVARDKSTLVYYESTRRLPESLLDAAENLGGIREAAICRELTKAFEEVRRGTLRELANHYAEAGAPKGECVVIVGPPRKLVRGEDTAVDSDKALKLALKYMSVKDASAFVAELLDKKKRPLYARALELNKIDDK